MNNDIFVLALFASRATSYDAKEAPISRWDACDICESEYPGLAGITRSTIYRIVERLLKQGLLKRAGIAPGRSQQRQLLTITAEGKQHLEDKISQVDVEVRDLRRPSMTLPAFMDYLILGIYVGGNHIESALERRIHTLKDTIRRRVKPVGSPEMDTLINALEHQAKIELSSLEHYLARHRQENKLAGDSTCGWGSR